MHTPVVLETLLRHLPAARRELLRKVIASKAYLTPAMISLPVNELVDLLQEPPEEEDMVEDLLH